MNALKLIFHRYSINSWSRLSVSLIAVFLFTFSISQADPVTDLSKKDEFSNAPRIKFHKIEAYELNIDEAKEGASAYLENAAPRRVTVNHFSNDSSEAKVRNKELNNDAPASFKLRQNYPNPFNPATEITYQLPVSRHVILKVYDMLGRPLKTLVDKKQEAGSYSVRFNASGLTSGMYLYRLKAGKYEQIRKMILIK